MSAFSRAKRTSLAKQTLRPKGTSRSAQAEHIVEKSQVEIRLGFFCDTLAKSIRGFQSADLSLGGDELHLTAVFRGLLHTCKRIYVFDFKKASKRLRFAFSTPCCEKQL
ncbi:MAG: hypothetical protein II370_04895, partial [Clostridia bacterium]|nr:hypothetical protein [Clostridia bacterium]